MSDLPKLVRDKIPEIIREDNKQPETRKVSNEEAEKWLREKVLEEAKEFAEEGEIEELADLYKVIQEYINAEDLMISELEKLEEKKSEERGGFDDRIILEGVENE